MNATFHRCAALALATLLAGCPSPFQAAVPDQVPSQAVSRVAGSEWLPFSGKPELKLVYDMAIDAKSNLYLIDDFVFRKLAPDGTMSVVKDQDLEVVSQPRVFDLAADGTIYAADMDKHTIYKFKPGEAVEVIAKAEASSHDLDSPDRLRVDGEGRVYVADSGQVFEISPTGFMSTLYQKSSQDGAQIGGVDIPASTEMVGLEVLDDKRLLLIDQKANVYVRDADGKGRTYKLALPKLTTPVPPELEGNRVTYRLDHKDQLVAFRDRYDSYQTLLIGQFFSSVGFGPAYNYLGTDVYRFGDEGQVTKHHFISVPRPGWGATFDAKGVLYLDSGREVHRIQL